MGLFDSWNMHASDVLVTPSTIIPAFIACEGRAIEELEGVAHINFVHMVLLCQLPPASRGCNSVLYRMDVPAAQPDKWPDRLRRLGPLPRQ